MIYIIGGVTRSGKSILARRLSKKYGLPYFNLDHLMMAMIYGDKDYGFHEDTHGREICDKAWPTVKPFLKSLIRDEKDGYIVEGALIRPTALQQFLIEDVEEDVSVCWMGYSTITADEKFKTIRQNHGHHGDWLENKDDDLVKRVVEFGVSYSKEIDKECNVLNIPFVDTSNNFEEALQKVEHILMKND